MVKLNGFLDIYFEIVKWCRYRYRGVNHTQKNHVHLIWKNQKIKQKSNKNQTKIKKNQENYEKKSKKITYGFFEWFTPRSVLQTLLYHTFVCEKSVLFTYIQNKITILYYDFGLSAKKHFKKKDFSWR